MNTLRKTVGKTMLDHVRNLDKGSTVKSSQQENGYIKERKNGITTSQK
jgi:hypothetical protein